MIDQENSVSEELFALSPVNERLTVRQFRETSLPSQQTNSPSRARGNFFF